MALLLAENVIKCVTLNLFQGLFMLKLDAESASGGQHDTCS